MIKIMIIDLLLNKVLDQVSYGSDKELNDDLPNLMSKFIKTDLKGKNIIECNMLLSLVNKRFVIVEEEITNPDIEDELLVVVGMKAIHTDNKLDKESITFIATSFKIDLPMMLSMIDTFKLKYNNRLDVYLDKVKFDNVKYYYL